MNVPRFSFRLLRQHFAEPKLLIGAFALNGIAYLPMLTLPWLVTSISQTLGLTATQAGLAGTVLLGEIALVAWIVAALLSRRRIFAVGIIGSSVAFTILAVSLLVPETRTVALLLGYGLGCGLACSAAFALTAVSLDPVRLNANMWGITVLWQILIWTAAPLLTDQAGLDGLLLLMSVGSIVLLAAALFARSYLPLIGPSTARRNPRSIPKIATIVLLVAGGAFWLRDSVTWSVMERRADMLGVTAEELAFVLVGVSIFGLAGAAVVTWGRHRVSERFALIASQMLAIAILTTIAAADTDTMFMGSVLFWSAATLMAWPFFMGLAARADPEGRVAAMCGGLPFAAGALGPLFGGYLLDRQGLSLAAGVLGLGLTCLVLSQIASRSTNHHVQSTGEANTEDLPFSDEVD